MGPYIIRRLKVEERTGLSRSSIYEKINPKSSYYDASFPKPVRLGKRAVGWRESEVAEWLASRPQDAA